MKKSPNKSLPERKRGKGRRWTQIAAYVPGEKGGGRKKEKIKKLQRLVCMVPAGKKKGKRGGGKKNAPPSITNVSAGTIKEGKGRYT